MVEIFGRIERNVTENGITTTEFIIPAFTERGAKRRAMENARLKGFEDREVTAVEEVGSADLPGQTNYLITVESTA